MDDLLNQSCTYEAPAGNDRDGNCIYEEAIELQKIRIVTELGAVKNTEGEAKNDVGTLYYKPFTSTPQIRPEALARVTYDGTVYTIRKVYPCYTRNGEVVHHYEAALV